ncbi:MAG TPA: HAD-IB family phosphatase [Planctomycetota bacterium]
MEFGPPGWQGAQIVFFDCDSTLSRLEGVDELARRRGADVAELTRLAMAGELPLDAVYGERLRRIGASAEDLEWLVERYSEEIVPGAAEVLVALAALGVAVHVISGGLLPAVAPFAARLGIPATRVHAVPFDPAVDLAATCAHPLARAGGKPLVIEQVCAAGPPRAARMLVGDGASDLEAAGSVGLFVGYGGIEARAQVREHADVFLAGEGLHAVALLAAGPARSAALERAAPQVYEYGLRSLRSPLEFTIRSA